jgi:hypothetical protein
LLGTKYKPFADFDLFDENEIPTNSDVAMMLTQYLSCFEKLRADNVEKEEFGVRWFWIVDGKKSDIRTVMPKNVVGHSATGTPRKNSVMKNTNTEC